MSHQDRHFSEKSVYAGVNGPPFGADHPKFSIKETKEGIDGHCLREENGDFLAGLESGWSCD
jgi:hypothetical protein